jgi:hypothetical protein
MREDTVRIPISALLAATTILAGSLSTEAHHSFTGAYNVDKTITITGTIIQIALRSPHSFFYVESKDAQGVLRQWAIEGASAGQFSQQGVDSGAFRVGDPVDVTANPSRTPNSTRARLVKIIRTTDGKSWGTQAGETVE